MMDGMEDGTWERWKAELFRVFVDDSVSDRAFEEWMECKQKGQENVVHYSERYERAVLRVQESQSTPMERWEERKTARFIEGLTPTLRTAVASRRTADFEEACRYEQRVETWQHHDEGATAKPKFKRVGAVAEEVKGKKKWKPAEARGADKRTCFGCGGVGHIR